MRLFIFATAIFLCSQTLAQTYEFEGFSVDLPAGVQVRKKMVDTKCRIESNHAYMI